MISQASSLFTQGQKKSWRKVKGSLGPLSWLSTLFSCYFLSSIIVLPRNSSISLGIRLFFLGNAPFREPILRSLCSLQNIFARTCLLIPIFCLLRFCFCWPGQAGNICILSDGGEHCSDLTPYVFLYESHKIFILHSFTMIHHPFPILHEDNSGRHVSPLNNSQSSLGNRPFYLSVSQGGYTGLFPLW